MKHTYTAFCTTNTPMRDTIWIDTVQAETPELAIDVARLHCAEDWGEWNPQAITVLGLALGDVNIICWNDNGIQS
jgi:hypothetical protein